MTTQLTSADVWPIVEPTPRALFAVCDVLVLRALEAVGKRIVRRGQSRSAYRDLPKGSPWYYAHTYCAPDERSVNDVLATSWELVPMLVEAHGCCEVDAEQVTEMLDAYVRDLLVTANPHTLAELRYRFERYLDLSVTAGD